MVFESRSFFNPQGVSDTIMFLQRVAVCLLLSVATQARYIVPGARWRDTEGNLVNAHAGGVTVDKNGTFWLFGEYKVENQVEGGGVAVYSSDDLATWTHHGLALGLFFASSFDLYQD